MCNVKHDTVRIFRITWRYVRCQSLCFDRDGVQHFRAALHKKNTVSRTFHHLSILWFYFKGCTGFETKELTAKRGELYILILSLPSSVRSLAASHFRSDISHSLQPLPLSNLHLAALCLLTSFLSHLYQLFQLQKTLLFFPLCSHLFPSCRRRADCSCRARHSICHSHEQSSPHSLLLQQRSCLAGFHASSHIAAHIHKQARLKKQTWAKSATFFLLQAVEKTFCWESRLLLQWPHQNLLCNSRSFKYAGISWLQNKTKTAGSSPGPSCQSTENHLLLSDHSAQSRCCHGLDLSKKLQTKN